MLLIYRQESLHLMNVVHLLNMFTKYTYVLSAQSLPCSESSKGDKIYVHNEKLTEGLLCAGYFA